MSGYGKFFQWRNERKAKKAFKNYYGKKKPNSRIWLFLVVLIAALVVAVWISS